LLLWGGEASKKGKRKVTDFQEAEQWTLQGVSKGDNSTPVGKVYRHLKKGK